VTTLYEHAGGDEGLHRLEEIFYSMVLADPLLQPLFGKGQAHHVEHLTWFTAESFGGPDRFTRELGFEHLIDVHRGLEITDEQRERFVALYLEALDKAGLPDASRSANRFALTSSSVHGSPSRTHERPPTTSSIHSTAFRAGSGKETTNPAARARTPVTSSVDERRRPEADLARSGGVPGWLGVAGSRRPTPAAGARRLRGNAHGAW
jgi:truncated hemoglobin YjbI